VLPAGPRARRVSVQAHAVPFTAQESKGFSAASRAAVLPVCRPEIIPCQDCQGDHGNADSIQRTAQGDNAYHLPCHGEIAHRITFSSGRQPPVSSLMQPKGQNQIVENKGLTSVLGDGPVGNSRKLVNCRRGLPGWKS
jgi:hypothetical protein